MRRAKRVVVEAECEDCAWQDGKAGNHGRAAQHHDRTGHEVSVTMHVVYPRTGPPADQLPLLDTSPGTLRP